MPEMITILIGLGNALWKLWSDIDYLVLGVEG